MRFLFLFLCVGSGESGRSLLFNPQPQCIRSPHNQQARSLFPKAGAGTHTHIQHMRKNVINLKLYFQLQSAPPPCCGSVNKNKIVTQNRYIHNTYVYIKKTYLLKIIWFYQIYKFNKLCSTNKNIQTKMFLYINDDPVKFRLTIKKNV